MNDVFKDLFDKCVIVYFDDIFIYLNFFEEYWIYVKDVLLWLCKYKFYGFVKKCEWEKDIVEYFGYILFFFGLIMLEEKIKLIIDWFMLKIVCDV